MLYFDSSLELEGVTLFRDYNTPSRYYYMPRAPHLTLEGGQPMFQLLIYRRDITDNPDFHEGDRPGGGFLTMTVDLGVPEPRLTAIKSQLASRIGGVADLVPVPFIGGTVRVSALGATSGQATDDASATGPRFVEKPIGVPVRPSLYGDNRAVFTMEVTHEGALLLKSSLEDDGASQVAVIYDLEYEGLMPAYEAKITIDFKQSYAHLRTRFNVSTLWFKSDLDREFEKLIKKEFIKIEEVAYLVADADPAKRAERAEKLTALAKDLATGGFFKPGLTPGKVLADDRGPAPLAAPAPPGASADGITAPLNAAGAGVGSPGDVAGPRLQGTAANPNAARMGGQTAPPADAATNAPAAPASAGNSAVDAWNRAGRPQASFVMRSLTQEEQQTIVYDLRQVSAGKRSASPQGSVRLFAGASRLAGRIKEVDLNDPFFEKIAGTVTSTADLEAAGVSTMVVKLRYGVRDDGSSPKDSQEFVISKAGDKGSYAFFLDRKKTPEIEYQLAVTHKAGFAIGAPDLQVTSPWIRTSTRNFDLDPRVLGAVIPVSLVVGNVDWNSVKSIQTTVSYDDPDHDIHDRRTVLLGPSSPPATVVPIRPRDPARRRYQVHSVYFYGTLQEVVDQVIEGDPTVVLNPPASRVVPISVNAVDPLGRYRKLTVELAYAPAGGEAQTRLIELPGDGASASVTLFRPDERAEARYRYRTTLFGRDGATQVSDWQESIERQLIVGDRFEGMLDVEVDVLAPDFASLGVMGLKLKLEYPDVAPGVKGTFERFDATPPAPYHVRLPRKRGGGDTYRYTVQWIRADRTIVTEGPVTTDAQSIQLFPPMGA